MTHILVALKIQSWTGRKRDNSAIADVADTAGATGEIGNFTKLLIDQDTLRALTSIDSKIRKAFYRRTLSFGLSGIGLTTDKGREALARDFSALAEERQRFVAENILARRENLIDEARTRLGALFNAADYPSESELAAKFAAGLRYMPLPRGEHMPGGHAVAGEIDEQTEEAMQDARDELVSRTELVFRGVLSTLAGQRIDSQCAIKAAVELAIIADLNLFGDNFEAQARNASFVLSTFTDPKEDKVHLADTCRDFIAALPSWQVDKAAPKAGAAPADIIEDAPADMPASAPVVADDDYSDLL